MKVVQRNLFLLLTCLFIYSAMPGEAEAKDAWVAVKSENFYLIGNASEKDIRRVGTKLEQFRETFRLLFSNMKLTGAVPTNVVVFKDDGAYKPFKPKRGDGKIDNEIAGFFQPGEDVNYITLSAGGDDQETFGTIFHEYVHWILDTNFGKSEVPPWFNEGLAEYYQTFEIKDDIRVKLGLPQGGHLNMLQQSQLIPLSELFTLTQYQVLQTGGHSRSIFYAQSWAMVHFLVQSGKQPALSQYLGMVTNGAKPDAAFAQAFQTNYDKMQSDLRNYVQKRSYNYNEITFKQKMTFDTQMTAAPLDDASVAAYLGDLLYHTNRGDDAEPYLADALRLKPDDSMANTSMGMVKLKQLKFDAARAHLERAIASDHKSHIAYYRYAYLLSREGRDEFGFVKKFEPATATKIRDALKKAIALNPAFTESYDLYAFVSLVNNEQLDEALALLRDALKQSPGNPRYGLRAADIYLRQNKIADAELIVERVERTSDDPEIRSRAQGLVRQIAQMREYEAMKAEVEKRNAATIARTGAPPKLLKRVEGGPPPTEAEMAKLQADQNIRSINEALRKPESAETRVIGRIQSISCKKRPLIVNVKTVSGGLLALTTKDFESLTLNSLDPAAAQALVGCDQDLTKFNAVISYIKSQLVAVEFVPADFRMMSAEEMATETLVIYDEFPSPPRPKTSGTNSELPQDFENQRREQMMVAIRDTLRKPSEGEKREIGYLDKVECTSKSYVFYLRSAARTYKLSTDDPRKLIFKIFAPDLAGIRMECGAKAIEYPVVFVFNEKSGGGGEIISLEFVPKAFKLEN
ncbi:MAG: tetratricopeptide repeat protein [Acidobacteria bacterium]|nr:tetratricopeptide repeat protein [Acidobacteriota bacterium]